MNFLEDYYSGCDEEGRLLSRHGQVEYLTTMRYIGECLEGISDPAVLEVGGTVTRGTISSGAGHADIRPTMTGSEQ